jgi:hypothetical protein
MTTTTTAEPNSIYARMARAFQIFDSYGNPNEQDISAEHDEIYAGPDPEVVSPEHLIELEALGWHASDGEECFYRNA